MRELPQQDHADLGIVDDDETEDLRRPTKRTAPEPQVLEHLAGTDPNRHHANEEF
jgi:hypothetical protein